MRMVGLRNYDKNGQRKKSDYMRNVTLETSSAVR